MQVVPGDTYKPTIWKTYKTIVKKSNNTNKSIENIERFAFYERAKKKPMPWSPTSETALYANIILKKGVVKE